MNKNFSKCLNLVLAACLSLSILSSCGPEAEKGDIILDNTKETINISMYVAGFGSEYMKTIVNNWNEAHKSDKYQFNISSEHTDDISTIEAKIKAGIKVDDIFLNDDSNLNTLKNNSALLDLSSVWTTKPEGNKTVEEKMSDSELYKKVYSTINGSIMAIPWTQGVTGMLYDHDFFKEEEWLLTDNTTKNGLTVGTDGVEGTFDDGLPQTIDEFTELCELISDSGFYPFIVSDKVNPWIECLETVMARYIGSENYKTTYTYSGNFIDPVTGNSQVITPANGYILNSLNTGLDKGFDFLNDFLFNENYRDSTLSGVDHIGQGERFLYSHKYKRVAMMFDGCWWENEKKFAFESDANRNGAQWGYGKRDIRYMPIPTYDGATDSLSGKSLFTTNNNGSIFALKSSDEEKNMVIKQFIANLVSNQSLSLFTKATNAMTVYKYEMSEEELNELTPFGRNLYEIINSDSVVITRPDLYEQQSDIYTKISTTFNRYGIIYNGVSYNDVYATVITQKRCVISDYLAALKNRYTANTWVGKDL